MYHLTLTEEILALLTNYPKGYRIRLMEMHRQKRGSSSSAHTRLQSASENTLRVTLSRLKKKGFVHNENGLWLVTQKGLARLVTMRRIFFPKHSPISKTRKQKNMIIAFDIPEIKRHKRDWLRIELANLGFKMLQQSVWFGSAPLPAQFIDSLQTLKIISHIKFFESKEADII